MWFFLFFHFLTYLIRITLNTFRRLLDYIFIQIHCSITQLLTNTKTKPVEYYQI